MSLMQRVRRILGAVILAVCAVMIIIQGENGLSLAALVISLSLILYAVRTLVYYFSMARHMVDGKYILFKGVILLDLGMLTLSVSDNASKFLVIYLLGAHVFSGGISILRALEARRFGAVSWRLRLTEGILNAFILVLCAVLIVIQGENGLPLAALVISLSLILYAVRTLVYYFTMARHMVDGKYILFKGVILLDLGVVTLSVSDNASRFLILYLLGAHVFSGGISILRALEARRFGALSWRLRLTEGILNLFIAAVALIFGLFLGSLRTVCWIYASGLIYSAILKIIGAFRKTAIVYIQ